MTEKLHSGSAGFTIIEIIIVIVLLGILTAVAVPIVGGIIEDSRIETTRSEMMVLKRAVVGPNGYLVTVGSNPTDPEDLVTQPAGVPAWDPFTQLGWNGPYINDDGSESYLRDAWDNDYQFTASEIRSAGPDETMDTADDIVIEY